MMAGILLALVGYGTEVRCDAGFHTGRTAEHASRWVSIPTTFVIVGILDREKAKRLRGDCYFVAVPKGEANDPENFRFFARDFAGERDFRLLRIRGGELPTVDDIDVPIRHSPP